MDQSNNNAGVLNLDEMLGEKKLTVRIEGVLYPIRNAKSLSPQEFGRIMAYGTKFSQLTDADVQKDGGLTIMKAIDDFLEIIGPELPKIKLTMRELFSRGYKRKFKISLQEATQIMQFWSENNKSKNLVRAATPKKKRIRH